jgi:hypothetical protein
MIVRSLYNPHSSSSSIKQSANGLHKLDHQAAVMTHPLSLPGVNGYIEGGFSSVT